MFEIYADEDLLYSSSVQEDGLFVLSPTCAVEVGMAGSLEFTLLPGHYLYSTLQKLKTKIWAYMDDDEIFSGRVLNWDIDMYKHKAVHCEGRLTYLLDTVQPPRNLVLGMTVSAYFAACIAEHNLQVDADKQFAVGVVTVDAANTVVMFSNTGYRDTRSTLDSDLIAEYGGILRTRTVNNVAYLDYIKDYGVTSSQTLTFGTNIVDLAENLSSTEIFTLLLPTGDIVEGGDGFPLTIETANNGSKLLENLDGISKYGRIVQTENFGGITDAAALKVKAQEYFTRMYKEPVTTLKIKAIDMHLFNTQLDKFKPGYLMRVVSPPHGIDTTLTCLSISYDFVSVENSEVTLGILVTDPGVKLTGSSGGAQPLSSSVGQVAGGKNGGALGQVYKYITESEGLLKLEAKRIELRGEDILLQASNSIILAVSQFNDGLSTIDTALTIEKGRITAAVSEISANKTELNAALVVERGRISATVQQIDTAENELRGEIIVEKDRISAEVSERVNGIALLSGRIDVTATNISLAVTNSTNADNTLTGLINVESGRITAEVAQRAGDVVTLNGRIDVTATNIALEVTDRTNAYNTLNGKITVEKDRITAEVAQRAGDITTLSGRIDVTATNISLAVTNSQDRDNVISGRISVSEAAITAEVGRAIGKEGELSGRITVTEGNINLAVTKAGIITDINIAPGIVKINAAKLDVPGLITAGAIAVTGDISAVNAAFNNLVTGTTAATTLRANSNITSFGSMGVNGTLTAGRVEVSGGAVVAAELNGTNIYAGAAIFLAGVNLQTTLNNKASDTALGSTNNALTILAGTVNNTHTPQITTINDTLYAHGQSLLGKLSTSGKAADSELLDGRDWSEFSLSAHTHDSRYLQLSGGHLTGSLTTGGTISGAVWNDYAEYFESDEQYIGGTIVIDTPNGYVTKVQKRLMKGCHVVSDTFGMVIGPPKNSVPIALTGRILALADKSISKMKTGDAVCSGKNGTISKMSRLECLLFPDKIIGIISHIPKEEEWHGIKTNGRALINV